MGATSPEADVMIFKNILAKNGKNWRFLLETKPSYEKN
jgi:hypothetical protein